jgi:hypothetical protein
MKTPLKWQLLLNADPQMIGGGKVLLVADQFSNITVWTEEKTARGGIPPRTREVVLVGTGHEIPESHPHHLGSVLMTGGTWVWHVYANFPGEEALTSD